MYKLKTDISLKEGEYLDVIFEGTQFFFKRKGEVIGGKQEIPQDFNTKRKLKAVVIKKEEDFYECKIIRFADLHRHSGFSLLDGAIKIDDMATHTEYAGALTDHGNMFGFLKYYQEMKNQGKQPIIGTEAYVETINKQKLGNHLVLLAKNEKGFKNLIKLSTSAYDNFYKKPHVSFDELKKHKEGIICLSGCLGGEIPKAIRMDSYEKAKKIAEIYKEIFESDFYLEIQRHFSGEDEEITNKGLVKLSKELGIKLVATTDSHYLKKEDKEIHEKLLALQSQTTIYNEKRMRFSGENFHILTPSEIESLFEDLIEAVDNTLEIAEKCSGCEITLDDVYLPPFEVPEGFTQETFFEKMVYDGFSERFKGTKMLDSVDYKERLEKEIGVIKRMGYPSYFLIVNDFIMYAKNNGILVGPGRGSAVGSLVAYCLNITDLDPIPYNLLFERFLNPDRVSLPDIDVDFCYERREEVIDYVKKKYGEDSVSNIITFSTFVARGAIRDMARVIEEPVAFGNKIAKMIPEKVGTTIRDGLNLNPELKELYDQNEKAREIIDDAMKVEGLPKNSSVHACGIIISNGPVSNYLPEIKVDGSNVSQVTMTEVETLGLLKFDFLGLKNLTIISKAIKSINEKGITLSYDDIPHTDPYVYREIGKGKSQGLFQLESPGMRSFMVSLYEDVDKKIKKIEKMYGYKGYHEIKGKGKGKPVNEYKKEMSELGEELFERLIAGISLYRPGPMEYIPNYLEGIRNPEDIRYKTKELEPILKETYNTIIYQEQVIRIVQDLAGYSLGRADLVRRAMGKKKIEVMEKEKDIFINGITDKEGNIEVNGCIRNGIDKYVAEEIWDQMADFCKYAFNKSHAAAYALLGAITGWLKTYHPLDFMAGTMSVFSEDSGKLKSYLSVANNMGIELLAPDINKSSFEFKREESGIRFGLKGIRNLKEISYLIEEEREERGEFSDFSDLVIRLSRNKKINKKALDGLINSGCLDCFEGTRRAKEEALDTIKDVIAQERVEFNSNQLNLFSTNQEFFERKVSVDLSLEEFSKKYLLEKEKEYLGIYLTEHPLDEYTEYFSEEDIVEVIEIIEEVEELEGEDMKAELVNSKYKKVKIAGIISDLSIFYSKKNGSPLFSILLEGKTGEIKAVMFNDKIEAMGEKIRKDKAVILEGMVTIDSFGLQLIVHNVIDIELLKDMKTRKRKLYIDLSKAKEYEINKVKELLVESEDNKNGLNVAVFIKGKMYDYKNKVLFDYKTESKLRNLISEKNYKVKFI